VKAKLFGGSDPQGDRHFLFRRRTGHQFRSLLAIHAPHRRDGRKPGGHQRREIVLLPGNGVVYCRKLELDDGFLDAERSGLLADRKDESRIELF
jgi:hypothetical protein